MGVRRGVAGPGAKRHTLAAAITQAAFLFFLRVPSRLHGFDSVTFLGRKRSAARIVLFNPKCGVRISRWRPAEPDDRSTNRSSFRYFQIARRSRESVRNGTSGGITEWRSGPIFSDEHCLFGNGVGLERKVVVGSTLTRILAQPLTLSPTSCGRSGDGDMPIDKADTAPRSHLFVRPS